MRFILSLCCLGAALCHTAFAQTAPPGPGAPVALTLDDALTRARAYSQQVYTAEIAARLAREDAVQARAALLPTVNWFNQFIYTQPNGTPSGVFVSNDGPHVYNNQAVVHGEIYNPATRASYRAALAAEALARAKADVAARGLIAVVVQDYYATLASQREVANAQQSLKEAQQFLDITRKQETGGEVAHADVVKAEILAEQRRREVGNAQLALEKNRIAFGVILFPDYGRTFTLVDDLEKSVTIPPFGEVQAMAGRGNPDLRAAQAAIEQQTHEVAAARAARLPSLSFDYFYGINANEYAIYDREHLRNLGSAAQAQLNIPIWTWGAARSKVRQAELRLELARKDLTFTQRQLLANLNSFYMEADTAALQMASLRRSLDLSAQSLKLTVDRYEAGEATALEVSDAQTTLAQARTAYDDGLVRFHLAVANLQTLTGVF
ncbi:MAG: TolC family protein [Acidobacteriia bacterium]|nr:TolC family protein [Terriglobia bacterium]